MNQMPALPEPCAPQLDIREVLNRRSDLSTFVVHLTREREGRSAKESLLSIIGDRRLRAGQPMGWALGTPGIQLNEEAKMTQRVVCFSETPLEHAYALFADIAARQVKLSGYGLAFTKMVARRVGINPVWYVEFTPGGVRPLANALNAVVQAAAAAGDMGASEIWKLTPFIEGMGSWGEPRRYREFWWEREWRHLGDLDLGPTWDKTIWLCPEDEIDEIKAATGGRPCIDPQWSLEQIIGYLSGLSLDDMTPFWAR